MPAGGMPEYFQSFLAFAALAVGIVIAIYSYLAAEKRRKELHELADSLGLSFRAHPNGIHDRYRAFTPLDRGHSRRSTNLIEGTRNGIRWEMFDFRYKTGSGKNQQTHHVGVVIATVPMVLPRLRMRPEGIFDKLAAAIGFDDINFESDEFSRRYHVSSCDRKLAYDLLHPQMIEYLLMLPRYDWQLAGPVILIWNSSRYRPSELPLVMSAIEGFVDRIPEYVREDLGVGKSPDDARRITG